MLLQDGDALLERLLDGLFQSGNTFLHIAASLSDCARLQSQNKRTQNHEPHHEPPSVAMSWSSVREGANASSFFVRHLPRRRGSSVFEDSWRPPRIAPESPCRGSEAVRTKILILENRGYRECRGGGSSEKYLVSLAAEQRAAIAQIGTMPCSRAKWMSGAVLDAKRMSFDGQRRPTSKRLPAVPRRPGLVHTWVAAYVSCRSRLINPWVGDGAGLPGRASYHSAAVSCSTRLVHARVAANVSCGSRLVHAAVPLGLHVRRRAGQKKCHRDRPHPPSNACHTALRVHDHVLLS